jgi:exoribonuclease R
MTNYKISVENRQYTQWNFEQVSNSENVDLPNIQPLEDKLFHGDTFIVNKRGKVEIVDSPTRKKKELPCVLILSNNKTFGRHTKGKLLYKCIPNDLHLPSFLVPYEIKHLGFSKVAVNLFVTISFQEWSQKHPTGTLMQTIGPITELPAFYEYQLYCKELQYSLKKMNQKVLPIVKEEGAILPASFQLENRTNSHQVFSIDPEGSLDFDDAFSICEMNSGKQLAVSVYIANVTLWLEHFNLWDFMIDHRVSTVYLPDNKRPMLPSILSDNLCSLKEKEPRYAFVLDFVYCLETNQVTSTTLTNAIVCVKKNYVYEETSLLKNKDYLLLEKVVKQMSYDPATKYMDSIKDSHDIVAYLMIYMNHRCAQMLQEKKCGIFRSIVLKKREENDADDDAQKRKELPENVAKFIQMTNSYSGKYVDLEKTNETVSHSILKIDAYIHITSPIRRLVDVLNMIQIQEQYGVFHLSEKAKEFYQVWSEKIDEINHQMKQIRIVQNECQLLHFFTKNPDLLNVSYEGYVYHQKKREDLLLPFQYTVYLPEVNMMTWFLSEEDLPEYSCWKFKLYVFHQEDKMKKKIRIQKL